VFESFSPLSVFDRLSSWGRGRGEKCFGEFLAERIFGKGRWITEDGFDFLFKARFIATTEDETRNEIGSAPGSLSQRNPESNEILGVHLQIKPRSEASSLSPLLIT